MNYFLGEISTFLLNWNPHFPAGNKSGWLSSAQNLSLRRDSGVHFHLVLLKKIHFHFLCLLKLSHLHCISVCILSFHWTQHLNYYHFFQEKVMSWLFLWLISTISILKSTGPAISRLLLISSVSTFLSILTGSFSWISLQFFN